MTRAASALPVVVGALSLSACATVSEQPGRAVAFQCSNGERVTVTFAGRQARFDFAGASVVLAQQPAASGFLYTGGGHSIRGKGDDLTWISPDRSPRDCSAKGQSDTSPVSLAGSNWQLAQFQSSDDAVGIIRPNDPTRYTLTFGTDGRLSARLDCNRAGARWTATPSGASSGQLSLTPGAMTRAMCPPGSMDSRIARDFARIRSYTLAGDTLNLALEADAGVYTWRKLP